MSDWATVDLTNPDLLQPSSDFGSDGEPYQPEPSQQDEMLRIHRRRAKRERSPSAESSESIPRRSALPGRVTTASYFQPGGFFDEETSSLAFVTDKFHEVGQSVHTQNDSPRTDSSPAAESEIKSEPLDPLINPSEYTELQQLRHQLAQARTLLDKQQGSFFTRLEALRLERDKYREEAQKWELKAESALQRLRNAFGNIGAVISDLEDGAAAYHVNNGKQHGIRRSPPPPLARQRRLTMPVPRYGSLPPSSPPLYDSPPPTPVQTTTSHISPIPFRPGIPNASYASFRGNLRDTPFNNDSLYDYMSTPMHGDASAPPGMFTPAHDLTSAGIPTAHDFTSAGIPTSGVASHLQTPNGFLPTPITTPHPSATTATNSPTPNHRKQNLRTSTPKNLPSKTPETRPTTTTRGTVPRLQMRIEIDAST
ncbi:hypothetical protein B0H16DRAFT_1764229 [Mycena metata]|uniref:Uncharacterized protein n=1 Tax=Mycena metata TaxID=1033252 RepID=A0AAD7I7Y5_9AGAR|nr:hypothetical protein B0H16DRAFT_1764229 [Mycena metata]